MIGTQTAPLTGPEETTRAGRNMSWQPYRFEDTPNLPRSEVRAQREMARLLPGPDAGAQLRHALAMVLQRLQGPEENLTLSPATEISGTMPPSDAEATQFGRSAPEAAVRTLPATVDDLVYIRRHGSAADDGWTPGPHPVRVQLGLGHPDLCAILETPLAAARSIVGAVVAVSPERLGASDVLTTVEQGVLAFFAERITAGMTERVPFLAPFLPVTIQDVVCENCDIDWGAEGAVGWYSVAAVVRVAGVSLPFRLVLPWAALERARRGGQLAAGDEGRLRRHRDHWLRVLGDAPVHLSAHLGRAELALRDLRELEPSDILLFESAGAEEEEGRLSGRLALVDAIDGTVRIETEIAGDDVVLQLRVQSLIAGHAPRTEEELRVSEDQRGPGAPDPESTQQNEAVSGVTGTPGSAPGRAAAEDTPVQLRVELGRLRLTVRELAQLSPGSILEMRRDPSAPVSLVVGDRVIGTGDLVRVEGELGVRIASLV